MIDFKNTVVIMTSNVGARDIMQGKTLGFHGTDFKTSFDKMQEKIKDEINKVFNPEFLNRVDDVIVFHPLQKEHIAQIVSILLREVQRRLGEEVLRLTPAAIDLLVEKGYDQNYGARPLKRAIQKYVEDPLSEKILLGDFSRGDEIEVDVGAGRRPALLPRPHAALPRPELDPARRPLAAAPPASACIAGLAPSSRSVLLRRSAAAVRPGPDALPSSTALWSRATRA